MPDLDRRHPLQLALRVLQRAADFDEFASRVAQPPPAVPIPPPSTVPAQPPTPAPRLPHPQSRRRQDSVHSAALIDRCGRHIDHLRVSVTSACDLRCSYCRPSVRPHESNPALSDAQRVELIACLHQRFGLSQLRLTGGEPLLHPGLVDLIANLRSRLPDIGLAMTTNGQRLATSAALLRRAGLDRLNISLDSLDPRRYAQITGGRLAPVLEGIDAARAAGFPPPRINCVVLRGVNDFEIVSLADWCLRRDLEARFLEAMPIGPAAADNIARFVPASQIRAALATRYRLTPLTAEPGQTAQRYRAESLVFTTPGTTARTPANTPDAANTGVIGIIAPVSEPFCSGCRRMRLTADGRLFPCLLDARSTDLRAAWLGDRLSPRLVEQRVLSAVEHKQPAGPKLQSVSMITLGG
ncbi:MAG: Coenzyme PQQ synthesis protein E [Phycisphaerae bacterium]|nr:Coenzyme PQQ synthesis protein E [Phycisphaerae bacterium]